MGWDFSLFIHIIRHHLYSEGNFTWTNLKLCPIMEISLAKVPLFAEESS